ncbi:hypothetical protein HYPSUDRAFT_41004 [Hypholoma sublateritium FD-334 SS-4]|uniref:Uncharacterized protein n=1 Tax=Hypholoma sublateritium (strain FD-334 SS-4) TaxID=945553 RepID=A0A0D2PR69_HYPSF|nr:hypothetical protein HYPSUDRAFT_41004 [Hypholoma sublateritium FD-334 SS-4]
MKLAIVSSIIAQAVTALATGWSLSTAPNLNCTSQAEILTLSSNITPIPCTPISGTHRQTFIVNENAPNCMFSLFTDSAQLHRYCPSLHRGVHNERSRYRFFQLI